MEDLTVTALLVPRRSRALLVVLVVVALAASWLLVGAPRAHAANGKVLILDTTLSTTAGFTEVDAAALDGRGADVVTPTQWAAMTTADFANYDAIVFADRFCANDDATILAPALANVSTWAPAVTGNVIVHTFDSTDHGNPAGDDTAEARAFTTQGIGFAVAQAGKTGMYFSSSCYNGTTWTTLLDGISNGWSRTTPNADVIHVVGSTPALAASTDATLSGWGQSTHNLVVAWPTDFTVYAIATDTGGKSAAADAGADNQGGTSASAVINGPYTAPDGTKGAPVILIRGADTSPSHILLQPATQTHDVGGTATLTATVKLQDGTPAGAGIAVTFTATAGPNAGKTMPAVTDASGVATISYSSAAAGSDTWKASFVDTLEVTETSNLVTVDWTTPVVAPLVIQPRFTG
jgi:hypothetical protein